MPVRKIAFGLSLAAAMSGTAFAADTPNAGQLLNEQQQQQMQLPQSLPQQQDNAPIPLITPEGPQVLVRDFHFTGLGNLAIDDELQKLVKPSVGKTLNFTQLQAIADKVTNFLKDKGWPLAHAYLPKQDVTAGHIEIAILQGHVESKGVTVIVHDTRLPAERIQKIVTNALPGKDQTPSQEDLERGILLADDMPGIDAHSTLERGSEPGTTKVIVDAKEGPIVTGSMTGDDYGNRFTGRWQLEPNVNINDPFGWGDQFSAAGTASTTGGLGLYSLGYSLPIANNGLRVSASFSHLAYSLDPMLAGVNAEGTAQTEGIRINYPIKRTRAMSVWAGADFTHKDLEDDVSNTVVSQRAMNDGGINGTATTLDSFLGGGMMTMTLAGTVGDLDRSAVASDLTTDSTTAQSNGVFMKGTAAFARLQHISEDFSFFASVHGQISDKNLDSSEKFILGGPSGIRAYPVGEGTGDEGWVSNLELRYDVPADIGIGKLQIIGFTDFGTVWLNHSPWAGAINTVSGNNSYSLAGAGLGANLSLTNIYSVRASWAHSIGDNPGRSATTGNNADGLSSNNEFWLQAVAQF